MRTSTTLAVLVTAGLVGTAIGDSGVDFRTAKWLGDRSVINGKGDSIATASDMILDRGEGRVTHLIVKTGTTLGLGGRAIAIPYAAFNWNPTAESLVLNSTEEELKTFPEFTATEWTEMMEAAESKGNLRRSLATDPAAVSDPYSGSLDDAEVVRIRGVVRSVSRERTSSFGEQTLVTVETGEGPPRTVALGPSWYVAGGSYVPMRGDEVVINARELPRDPSRLAVATDIRSDDRELRLRDKAGAPAWSVKSIPVGERKYESPYWRYMLASSLRGSGVSCRGENCGVVENVIVERHSGDIAFLSIDPDAAILGIGDTSRLIPWSVVSVSHDGKIRIDASKEMVLASQPTPSELNELTGRLSESVYSAYGVSPPRFHAVTPTQPSGVATGDAWGRRGAIITGIERDSTRTLTGKVRRASELALASGIPPARSIAIDAGGTEEVVLLGPDWYMSKQALTCQPGDIVTAEVSKTRVNGKTYWIARSFEVNGTRVQVLDASNRPAWDGK